MDQISNIDIHSNTDKDRYIELNRVLISILLVVLPCFYIGSSLDPFNPPKILLVRFFSGMILSVLLARNFFNGVISCVSSKVSFFIILFIIWAASSFLYAVNKTMVFETWINLICGLIIFYSVLEITYRTNDYRRILFYVILPVFALAPLTVFDILQKSVFPWDSLINSKLFSIYSVFGVSGGGPGTWIHNFDGRVSASLGNPVYLAGFLVLLLAPAWAMYVSEKRKSGRLVYASAVILIEFMLVATFTRSAWAAALISFLFYESLILLSNNISSKKRKKREGYSSNEKTRISFGKIVCVIALVAIAGFFYSKNEISPIFSVSERIGSVADPTDGSRVERTLIWKTAWEAIKDNPLIGVGLGNYYISHPKYQRHFFSSPFWLKHISFPDRVHNEFLDVWAETGIVGALLALIIIGSIIFSGVKSALSGGEERFVSAGLASGCLGLAIYSCVQFPFHIHDIFIVFVVFAGILTVLGNRDKIKIRSLKFKRTSFLEKFLFAGILFFGFVKLFLYFSEPLMGNIAFYWGVSYVDEKPVKALEMMIRGTNLDPDNTEMSIRYGIYANNVASSLKQEKDRVLLYNTIKDESIRGLTYMPTETRLYDNLGGALIRLNEPERAEHAFQKVLYYSPTLPYIYYNIGITLYMLQNYPKAIYYYKKAAGEDSGLPGVYQNIGIAYFKIGNNKRALQNLEKELKRNRNAIEEYSGKMFLKPKYLKQVFDADKKLLKTGRIVENANNYNAELGRSVTNKQVHNGLGLAYSAMSDSNRAVDEFKKALSIDPHYIEAQGNLGIEYINLGLYSEAEKELKKVAEKNPYSETAHYQLKKLYGITGRSAEYKKEDEILTEIKLKTVSGMKKR